MVIVCWVTSAIGKFFSEATIAAEPGGSGARGWDGAHRLSVSEAVLDTAEAL